MSIIHESKIRSVIIKLSNLPLTYSRIRIHCPCSEPKPKTPLQSRLTSFSNTTTPILYHIRIRVMGEESQTTRNVNVHNQRCAVCERWCVSWSCHPYELFVIHRWEEFTKVHEQQNEVFMKLRTWLYKKTYGGLELDESLRQPVWSRLHWVKKLVENSERNKDRNSKSLHLLVWLLKFGSHFRTQGRNGASSWTIQIVNNSGFVPPCWGFEKRYDRWESNSLLLFKTSREPIIEWLTIE